MTYTVRSITVRWNDARLEPVTIRPQAPNYRDPRFKVVG